MIKITCENNMQLVSRYPDKFFNLANEDPPYFSGPEKREFYGKEKSTTRVKRKNYPVTDNWVLPTKEWFEEVKRVSINQIIWGANYFDFIGEPFKTPRRNKIQEFIEKNPTGWIIWDKCNGTSTFNDFELAWTSFDRPTVIYRYMWNGMMQGKSMLEGHIMQGDKKLNQKRAHPTEKPVILYDWCYHNYTQPGDIILSGHIGSGSDAESSLKFDVDFIGCDITQVHVDHALKRIELRTRQTKLIL